ncbi:MAG: FAD-dependent thymidylate synthase [Candidatus Tantalella remota]|nr:FAD-dependent thymidylate synthase [Candidatus Tantalella remota]
MKVSLAGYNVDTSVLKELEDKAGKREDITPEVISAAYARISRDPRPIDEIRKDARKEVKKSRRSNTSIIFKMGHHSVAEHAVFNLDIIGVSRLVMEEVEKFRLCAYTEKSQRYITLDKDFVVPAEIKGTSLEKDFTGMVRLQNEAYAKLLQKLQKHVFEKFSDLATDPKKHNMLEGWAKEDARYITALATEAQVGQTINARNMELLLRRFASHPLAEVKELGRALYREVSEVAPSVVIFNEANDRDLLTYPELKELAAKLTVEPSAGEVGEVELVEYTPEGDDLLSASLLHVSSDLSYDQCKVAVKGMLEDQKKEIFKVAWRNMQFYDSMLREFEYANLTFNIVLSSACFGQLKRHRMATITSQEYDPSLGITVPESVKEIGMEPYFREIADKTVEVYEKIRKESPLAAPYILTNAHRKRVLIKVNARELYHISRLREDAHAQWDIQNISRMMTARAKEAMPLAFEFAGGKDRFNDIYQNIYGQMPKVIEAVLPGARKIK